MVVNRHVLSAAVVLCHPHSSRQFVRTWCVWRSLDGLSTSRTIALLLRAACAVCLLFGFGLVCGMSQGEGFAGLQLAVQCALPPHLSMVCTAHTVYAHNLHALATCVAVAAVGLLLSLLCGRRQTGETPVCEAPKRQCRRSVGGVLNWCEAKSLKSKKAWSLASGSLAGLCVSMHVLQMQLACPYVGRIYSVPVRRHCACGPYIIIHHPVVPQMTPHCMYLRGGVRELPALTTLPCLSDSFFAPFVGVAHA